MKDKVPVRWRFILQVNNGKREDATAGENPKGNKEIWESREVSYENINRWTLSLETSLIRVYQSLFCEALVFSISELVITSSNFRICSPIS